MAKALTSISTNQIELKSIKPVNRLYINSIDVSSYLLTYNISYDTNYGSASASFSLNNNSNIFGDNGTQAIEVGQVVEFIQKYDGDTIEYKKFYGFVNQRSYTKNSGNRQIDVICLDYISALKFYDIDLTVEGTKVLVENETLTPNFLPSPNEKLAQVFDFANNSIATNPLPIIMIKDKLHNTYDPQYDGFSLQYASGQLKLGSPLQAQDNYDVVARSYYFYNSGVYAEDVLEQIITQANGYDGYLFGEESAQDVIDNHLKETFSNVQGTTEDYCVDTETQALTKNGWKYYNELNVGDEIWSLNTETGEAEWDKIKDFVSYNYKGKLKYLHTESFNALVTNDHKWVVKPSYAIQLERNQRKTSGNNYKKYKFTDTKNLKVSDHLIRKPDKVKENYKNIYSDDFVRLIGWFVTEGYHSKEKKYVTICQSEKANKEKCLEIENILNNLNYKYLKSHKKNGMLHFNIKGELYKKIIDVIPNKVLNFNFLNNLNYKQKEYLIDALIKGDGTVNKRKNYTSKKFFSTDIENVEGFLYLLITTGRCGSISKRKPITELPKNSIFKKMPKNGFKPMYVVQEINNPYSMVQQLHIKDVDYDGVVWCPSVKNKTWLMRRKGKVTFTGNCTPNYTTSTITIRHNVNSAITAGDTSITLDSVEGLPDSGEGTINGDTFTWSSIGSGNTLQGIPSTGSYALKTHADDSIFKYESTYAPGRVWHLRFTNVQTDLTSSDFTIPGGTFAYFDKRYGRILLESAINLSSIVKCNSDYMFKTIQASGIELNSISFKPRELNNRFEAIDKLKRYLAPNYIIRTQGDNKIWAGYLRQNVNEDYTLNLKQNLLYLEDEDLYTRTIFYAQNRNPSNITFNEGVDFYSTGESYKGLASLTELIYAEREDGDYWVYGTSISGAGYIDVRDFNPIVYINGVAVDNQSKKMINMQVVQDVRTRTTIKTGCHGWSSNNYTKIHTYYYYTLRLPHTNIMPTEPIYFYDAFGNVVLTVSPNNGIMDYARGIYLVPGEEQNSVIESIATASYTVFYSTGLIDIDYDNVFFKISKTLVPNPLEVSVSASFEYWTVMIPIHDIASVIDGRWDTQVQIEFYSEPPSNYPLTIIDLGAEYPIQAIDVVAGFYKPDDYRKFDIGFNFTLLYSNNGTDFYEISDETHNVSLNGGDSVSFEEEDLGVGFTARYIKVNLEDVEPLDYGTEDGVYVVAFAEIALYSDIVLKSEAKLIPTTTVSDTSVGFGDTTLNVVSTEGFTEPSSAEEITAYIDGDAFTYTGLTSTSFTGCTFTSGGTYDYQDRVSKSLSDDNSIYDDTGLLPKLGDRLYKDVNITEEVQYTQSELDNVSKAYLEEYVKNHTKVQTGILFAPYLNVGDTVKLTDSFSGIDRNYFVEGISSTGAFQQVQLAYYPS